jgi:hypothetical protein
MGQEPEDIRKQIETTREEMGNTVEAMADRANVPGRVKRSLKDRQERVMEAMGGTGQRVNEATPSTDDVREGAQKAAGIAQENPLGLAIGGLAVGFLAGLALPSTRVENERIGPVADDLKDKAAGVGQEALERGKVVAQEAAQAAGEAARESGTEQAEELKESAREQAGVGTS